MSSFVLVHGSWHGAWCWYKVAPRLRGLGHKVFAVDMPGHGRNPKPPQGIGLGDYFDAIVKAVDRAAEPVVLVGHSRGGIAISQAGEARPDGIARLVYLAAYMLRSGETVLDVAAGDADSRYPLPAGDSARQRQRTIVINVRRSNAYQVDLAHQLARQRNWQSRPTDRCEFLPRRGRRPECDIAGVA